MSLTAELFELSTVKSGLVKEPDHIYHAHKALSREPLLTILRKTPQQAKLALTTSKPSTPAMDFGSAVHTRLLEPELYDDQIEVFSETLRNSNKFRAAREVLPDGKRLIDRTESALIEQMETAFRAHPECQEIMESAAYIETSCYWREFERELDLRCRADIVTDTGFIFDLKTTTDVSERAIMETIRRYDYLFQAALYCRGFSINLRKLHDWGWIFIQKSEPFDIVVVRPDPADLEHADTEVELALERWAECEQTKSWPGYPSKLYTLPPMSTLR